MAELRGRHVRVAMLGDIVTDSAHSHRAAWADYDGDGWVDLYVANFGVNCLYRNNGNGGFTKVTTGHIVTDSARSRAAAWADYDGDGWVDLFVANSYGFNHLYRNNGAAGGFTRVTTGDIFTDNANSRAVAWADYVGANVVCVHLETA